MDIVLPPVTGNAFQPEGDDLAPDAFSRFSWIG
jgi:hypothetical protein